MDAVELLKEAERLCNNNKITIGEYEQIIAPLHDVEPVVRCKNGIKQNEQ